MKHYFFCHWYGRTTIEPGCVCGPDEEDEMNESSKQAPPSFSVPCPVCGAKTGQPCSVVGWSQYETSPQRDTPHIDRLKALKKSKLNDEDEMPKLDDQTKVEILKSKEQQLIDAIAEAIDAEQKRLALDALQSVRAALRRCEATNDTANP